MDEVKVIENIKQGNKEAFSYLIDKYQDYIFKIMLGFVHRKDLAEDLTQEVFIKVWWNIDKYKPIAKFSTWLYKIAVNTAINYLRKEKREHLFTDINKQEEEQMQQISIDSNFKAHRSFEADTKTENAELAHILHRAIASLPKRQRIAFVLVNYMNMNYKDIAEVLDTTYSTVQSLIFRAKRNLQKQLLKFMNNEM